MATHRRHQHLAPRSAKRQCSPVVLVVVSGLLPILLANSALAEPWTRHTIDNSSRGADGVRVADVNRDQLPDLATGWEEGGVVRVYLHPGASKVRHPWPAVTVGKVRSPEDAVFVDLDGDGATDVVTSCEGRTRTVYVHWAPSDSQRYLDDTAWKTEPIPCTQDQQSWMFALPMQIDGTAGVDLIVGSKGSGASVSWLQSPGNARELDRWKRHRICDAGWIMSLQAHDWDSDGDRDVLFTDRRGPTRGVRWLQFTADADMPWRDRLLGAADREVMFLSTGQIADVSFAVAVRGRGFSLLSRDGRQHTEIPMPANCGTGKGVAIGDIDRDGVTDLVFTCEAATGDKSGVRWLSRADGRWVDHEISGAAGVKFDRLELLDLDGDGDLDVVTCEERANLGVIWYENPTQP